MKQGTLQNEHKHIPYTSKSHTSNQNSGNCYKERERERPTNISTQKMRWVIIYTAKCLHSLVYNIYVHK